MVGNRWFQHREKLDLNLEKHSHRWVEGSSMFAQVGDVDGLSGGRDRESLSVDFF